MPSDADSEPRNVKPITADNRPCLVCDELLKLKGQLAAEFPETEGISFEFRKDLRLHIDVRSLEEARIVEARLPALCGGAFSQVFVGKSPNHSFFHRVSAKVSR